LKYFVFQGLQSDPSVARKSHIFFLYDWCFFHPYITWHVRQLPQEMAG
jgi:hypothetical protein